MLHILSRTDGMTTREALRAYLTEKGIRDKDDPDDQLYKDGWFRVYVGHRSLRLFPLGRMINSLALHDLHHLMTGYGTGWVGEAELVGWELASGGCGRHWIMWVDRLGAIPLMLIAPRVSWRAIRAGWRCRNLYRTTIDELLERDFEQTQRLVRPTQ